MGINRLNFEKIRIGQMRDRSMAGKEPLYGVLSIFRHALTETGMDAFPEAMRVHWGIENQLHWCWDVILREDASRAKRDHSPLHLNGCRKTALTLLKAADFGRIGIRKKMFHAALSIPSLEYVLTGEK